MSLQVEKDKCKDPEADWTLSGSRRPETHQLRNPAFREVSAGLTTKKEALLWEEAFVSLQRHGCVTSIPEPVAGRSPGPACLEKLLGQDRAARPPSWWVTALLSPVMPAGQQTPAFPGGKWGRHAVPFWVSCS